jgi:hypothetical protein
MYKPVMQRVIRIVLLFILVSAGGTARGQQSSASPVKPNPAPTPIPLANVPFAAQSATTSLHAIDTSVAKIQTDADAIESELASLLQEKLFLYGHSEALRARINDAVGWVGVDM